MRWIARIWSLLLLALVVVVLVTPNPLIYEPLKLQDWLVLFTYPGLAVLGLLLAWRWEVQGALLNLAAFLLLMLETRIIYGGWFEPAAALLLFALFSTPAIILLLCTWETRAARAAAEQE